MGIVQVGVNDAGVLDCEFCAQNWLVVLVNRGYGRLAGDIPLQRNWKKILVLFLGVGPLLVTEGVVARVWVATCGNFVDTNREKGRKFPDDFEMKVVRT